MNRSQVVPKAKLEDLIALGLIKSEDLEKVSLSFFESTKSDNREIMVNISTEKCELQKSNATKTSITAETMIGLSKMGLFDRSKIDAGEITWTDFKSKFGEDTKMITFTKAGASAFDDLFIEPAATQAEMGEDGTLDMDAPVAEATAEVEDPFSV